ETAPEGGIDSPTDAADDELAKEASGAEPPAAPHEFRPGEAETPADRGAHEDPDIKARQEDAVAGQDLSGQAHEGAEAPSVEQAAPAEAAESKPAKKPSGEMEEAESDQAKAALDEAVGNATGTSGDRLARLREALHAVGKQADRVRLVRVFSAEEPVAGSPKIGQHPEMGHLMPPPMNQEFQQEEKCGR